MTCGLIEIVHMSTMRGEGISEEVAESTREGPIPCSQARSASQPKSFAIASRNRLPKSCQEWSPLPIALSGPDLQPFPHLASCLIFAVTIAAVCDISRPFWWRIANVRGGELSGIVVFENSRHCFFFGVSASRIALSRDVLLSFG